MGTLRFKRISQEDELREVYSLRYRVYCEERGYERHEDHPDGLERDCYDPHSIHFAAYNDRSEVIGTARIILDSAEGFPLERNCIIDEDVSFIERKRLGEISRLAVSKDYRRRAEDQFIYDCSDEPRELPAVPDDRRRRHEIVLGLYKLIYIESRRMGLTHWYTAMGRGLYLLMSRMGVAFEPIGPEINYHGLRRPYMGSIETIEETVRRLNPVLFAEASEGLGSHEGRMGAA